MGAFLFGRGRGPCGQRPFLVEVFFAEEEVFEGEDAFVDVEAAFETPIFL